MSEAAPNSQGGINPDFRLTEIIDQAEATQSRHFNNAVPVAVAAADRLFEDIYKDKKTGLKSGEYFKKQLDKVISELGEGDELAITIFDVDNFKQVNDVLGHAKGDELLGIIGKAFEEVYRRSSDTLARGQSDDSDRTARLHGDEFGASILNKSNESEGLRVHTALEEAEVQAARLDTAVQEKLKDTVFDGFGLGLAHASKAYHKGDTAETVVFKADIEMIVNKCRGKIERLNEEDKAWLNDTYNLAMIKRLNIRLPDYVSAYLEPAETDV